MAVCELLVVKIYYLNNFLLFVAFFMHAFTVISLKLTLVQQPFLIVLQVVNWLFVKCCESVHWRILLSVQSDHLSGKPGKPGNVREFHSSQGNVRNCRRKIFVRKKVFIVNFVFGAKTMFSIIVVASWFI